MWSSAELTRVSDRCPYQVAQFVRTSGQKRPL